MSPILLVKQIYGFYIAAVVGIISRRGHRIDALLSGAPCQLGYQCALQIILVVNYLKFCFGMKLIVTAYV